MTRGRLEGIEGVRGLAALSVVFYHAWSHTSGRYGYGIPPVDEVFGRMRLGFTVFFVLSGFLLFRPFVAAILAGTPRPALGRYAAGRLLRIVPAYWLALVVVVAFSSRDFDPGALAQNFLFLQSYFDADVERTWVIMPGWTLCVEIAFYAALPLLAWAAGSFAAGRSSARGRAGRLLLFCALLASLAPAYKALALDLSLPLLSLPAFLDQFAAGMMLAVVFEWMSSSKRTLGAAARRGLLVGAVLVFAGVTAVSPERPTHDNTEGAGVLLYGGAASISVALVLASFLLADRGTRIGAVLSSRPLFALGVVSYGVYLWHSPLLHLLGLRGGLGMMAAAAVLASLGAIAIATVSWFVVEKPTLSLRTRRRVRRLEPHPEPVAAPTS